MNYRLEFTKSARKEFEKLPDKIRLKTVEALQLLSQNPQTEWLQIKKIKGADYLYRFRVGEYRVVYECRDTVLLILVIKVGHRKEVYRRL